MCGASFSQLWAKEASGRRADRRPPTARHPDTLREDGQCHRYTSCPCRRAKSYGAGYHSMPQFPHLCNGDGTSSCSLVGFTGLGGGVRLVEQHLPGTSSYVWCLLSCWSRPRAASCQSFSNFFPYREARLSLWPCPQESPHLLPTAEVEDGSLSRVAWWPPIHHMVPGRSPREPPPSTRYEPRPQPGPTGPTNSLQTEQSPGCLFSVTPVPAGYLKTSGKLGWRERGGRLSFAAGLADSWGIPARSPLPEPPRPRPPNPLALAVQAPLTSLVIKHYGLITFNFYNFRNTLTHEK